MKLIIFISIFILAAQVIPTGDYCGPGGGYDGSTYCENADISKPMLPSMIFNANLDFGDDGLPKPATDNEQKERLKCLQCALAGVRPYDSLPQNIDHGESSGYCVFWHRFGINNRMVIYKDNVLKKIINAEGEFDVWKNYIFVKKQRRYKDKDRHYGEYFVVFVVDLEGDDFWEFKLPDNLDSNILQDRDLTTHHKLTVTGNVGVVDGVVIDLASMKPMWDLNENENFIGFDGDTCYSLNKYEKYEEGKDPGEMVHFEIVSRKLSDGSEIDRVELVDRELSKINEVVDGVIVGQIQTFEKQKSYVKQDYTLYLARLETQRIFFKLDSERWEIDFRITSDGKYVYANQYNRQLCIETKTGNILWSIPMLQVVALQSVGGKLYTSWESTDENGENWEHISAQGNSQWIVSKPKRFSGRNYNNKVNQPSLVPVKEGIIWVPSNHDDGNPQLISYEGKTIREYSIPGWTGKAYPVFAVVGDRLLINPDGRRLCVVSIKTGQCKEIDFQCGIENDYPFPWRLVWANEHYCVTPDNDMTAIVIDIPKMEIVFSERNRIYPFSSFVELKGSMIFGMEGGPFNPKEGIKPINYDMPRYFGMLKNSYFETQKAMDKKYNVISEVLVEKSFDGTKIRSVSKPEQIDRYTYDRITPFELSTDGRMAKCTSAVVNLEDSCTQYLTIYDGSGYTHQHILMPTKTGFIQSSDNIIYEYKPCPTYSVRRTGDYSFEITVTSSSNLDPFEGKAYLVPFGDEKRKPDILLDSSSEIKIEKLTAGKKTVLLFKPSEKMVEDLRATEKFGLVIESNGLLDTRKSELSENDKENRARYDGIPMGTAKPASLSVTVWRG